MPEHPPGGKWTSDERELHCAEKSCGWYCSIIDYGWNKQKVVDLLNGHRRLSHWTNPMTDERDELVGAWCALSENERGEVSELAPDIARLLEKLTAARQ